MAEANHGTRVPVRPPTERIVALDALRGFALCGIIFVNIYQVMLMEPSKTPGAAPVPDFLLDFVQARFYPIFSLLFGVGFGIFLRAAESASDGPRVLLFRRMLVLGVFGLLHGQLQPGEVLLPYAVVGIFLLLPLSFAPRWVSLVAGVVLSLAAVLLYAGGIALIPGVFALGFAAARYAIPETLAQRTGQLAVVFAACVVTGLGTAFLRTLPVSDPVWQRFAAGTALSMSFAYLVGFLLLLRTPLTGALSAIFAPLGRMALTNYVSATLLFLPIGHAIGLYRSSNWDAEVTLAVAILVLQAIWSLLWLRWFRYGPLEWVWRWLTWVRLPPMRR